MSANPNFLSNKYTRWYYAIIESAKNNPLKESFERHHIIPRSLGGSDKQENLVNLSFRQHYACHVILTKMLESDAKRKMVFALHMMSIHGPTHCRTSKSYEYTKKLRRLVGVSEETKLKTSITMKGLIRSKETCEKISIAKQNLSIEAKNNIRLARIGKKHSQETLLKISESKKNPSIETRNKMKKSHEGKIPWNKGLKGVQIAWNKGQTKAII